MTSFAKTLTPGLAPEVTSRTEFTRSAAPVSMEPRDAVIVREDKPIPQPRPSPGLAQDVDRESFNQRWEAEQRAARKAAFIQMRTDTQTGGRIRILQKTFNR